MAGHTSPGQHGPGPCLSRPWAVFVLLLSPSSPDWSTHTPALLMLAVDQLTFAYDTVPVLKDVAFFVEAGKFVALLGPNGAGKSTLLSLMTGQFTVPRGHITIAGYDLASARQRALGSLGIVFQSPTLDLDLTVEQNLAYFGGLQGLSASETEQRSQSWLHRLDLTDRLTAKIRTLSGGQRRRVEIVRALLHDPKVLLLDEPTTGLDVPTRLALVDLVHDLASDHGITVLWATHLIDEIQSTDELVVLQNGRVIATGDQASILASLEATDLNAIAGGVDQATVAP